MMIVRTLYKFNGTSFMLFDFTLVVPVLKNCDIKLKEKQQFVKFYLSLLLRICFTNHYSSTHIHICCSTEIICKLEILKRVHAVIIEKTDSFSIML